ncbi:MAG: type II toxin-antitoxin system HicB family antitoxin [Puniceicoccales bacterium]
MNYIYWQDGANFIGYLEAYPDYQTQGSTLSELEENLADLHKDLTSGDIPNIRKIGKLVVAS